MFAAMLVGCFISGLTEARNRQAEIYEGETESDGKKLRTTGHNGVGSGQVGMDSRKRRTKNRDFAHRLVENVLSRLIIGDFGLRRPAFWHA